MKRKTHIAALLNEDTAAAATLSPFFDIVLNGKTVGLNDGLIVRNDQWWMPHHTQQVTALRKTKYKQHNTIRIFAFIVFACLFSQGSCSTVSTFKSSFICLRIVARSVPMKA